MAIRLWKRLWVASGICRLNFGTLGVVMRSKLEFSSRMVFRLDPTISDTKRRSTGCSTAIVSYARGGSGKISPSPYFSGFLLMMVRARMIGT